MNEEKLSILKMLEDGKINYSEASRLLEILDNYDNAKTQDRQDIQVSHTIKKAIEDLNLKTSDISIKLLEKFNEMDKSISEGETLSFKKLNKSLQKISKELQNKINVIIDSIDKDNGELSTKLLSKNSGLNKIIGEGSLSDINNLNTIINGFDDKVGKISPNIIKAASDVGTKLSSLFPDKIEDNTQFKSYISEYTKPITESEGLNLKFEGINGNILVQGNDNDEIEAKVYYKSSEDSINDYILITDELDNYGFKVGSALSQSISYHVRLPALKFKDIFVSTSNGKIKLSDICCNTLICITSNGKISLSGITCNNIQCTTTDGKINVSDVRCKNIFVKTSNAPVLADNLDSTMTNINTTNGKIALILSDDLCSRTEINVSTTNGKIDVTLPILSNIALYIDARADSGIVTTDIPGISFDGKYKKSSDKGHVIYETPNFKNEQNSIKITASTTNNSINFK